MRIYVARHGQTQWNVENKVCGRTDLPLTEKGLAQAEMLGEQVKDLNLDLIISSPLAPGETDRGSCCENVLHSCSGG